MIDLLASTIAYFPFTLLPLLLLLVAPSAERGPRLTFAAIMVAGAGAMGVISLFGLSEERSLDVINPFPGRGAELAMHVTEQVSVPGWQWPLVGVAALLFSGLVLALWRERPLHVPHPIIWCGFLSIVLLAVRLGFEKTAAPEGLIWATGISATSLPMLCFFGGFAGTRQWSYPAFVAALLIFSAIQRGVVCGWSYFATTRRLGTHLDVSSFEQIDLPLLGTQSFGSQADPMQQWLWATVVPQMTMWVLLTVAVGVVLGSLPFFVARRRAS